MSWSGLCFFIYGDKMTVMTEVQTFSQALFQDWSLSGSSSLVIVVLLYLLASWMVCFAAAFCKVRETKYYVGLISVGMTLLVAMLLAGICRFYLPDLAKSFSPWGLMVVCTLIGIFTFAVPLIQSFWRTTYFQGFACIMGGILIFLGVMMGIQSVLNPGRNPAARLTAPLFEDYQPDFSRSE